jgi:hypothetical protein
MSASTSPCCVGPVIDARPNGSSGGCGSIDSPAGMSFAPHSKNTFRPVRYSTIVPSAMMQPSTMVSVANARTSDGRTIYVTRK